MKATNAPGRTVLGSAFLALMLMTTWVSAGPKVTSRPLSDFLDAQGSTVIFFPPVADMVGWVGADFETFALIDYAGLADDWVEGETGSSLGSRVRGRVTERTLKAGTAEVRVRLHSRNVLAIAQSVEDLINSGFDFVNTPTSFGVKAQDVVDDGAEPTLGMAILDVTLIIGEPGAALPDLRLAVQDEASTYTPKFSFLAVAHENGARLKVHQVGEWDPEAGDDGMGDFVFSKEIAEVKFHGDKGGDEE